MGSAGYIDRDAGEWVIPFIPPGGTADVIIQPAAFFPRFNQDTPVRLHAELVSHRYLASEAGSQGSIETEDWYIRAANAYLFAWPGAEVGVRVRSLNNRVPALGTQTQTTFDVRAINVPYNDPDPRVLIVPSKQIGKVWDVKIKIDLSPGLSLAPGWTAPTGTSFDAESGIWNVGLISGANTGTTMSLPVLLAADNVPLEQRCLTATVVSSTPDFELDPGVLVNDFSTKCLGEDPILNEGDIAVFKYVSCVGRTSYPCTSDDTLELVAKHEAAFWQPEDVIVQVRDVQGRVEAGWSTGKTARHLASVPSIPGVGVIFEVIDSGYNAYTFAISDVVPKQRPGKFTVVAGNEGNITILDADTMLSAGPYNLNEPIPALVVFGTLGTYKVKITVGATKSGTAYTDSGVYTFHVGPIAELAVRDGGRSPLAAPDQQAYTILAANNGPDAAGAVRVTLTGVPQGAEAIVSGSTKRVDDEDVSGSDGRYAQGDCVDGFCEATWTIGKMSVSSGRTSIGKMPFPTLTLIAPDGASTSGIEASIESTEPYSVTIDGTVHSTAYFDYIDENNSAHIAARAGAGGPVPGTPQDLQAQFYTVPFTTALVWWTELESVNGFPVSRYEVFTERPNGGACQAPSTDQAGERLTGTTYADRRAKEGELTCYYVRAVNTHKVPGYWAGPVMATGDSPDQPRLSVQGGDPVDEGDAAQFTVSASPAPAAGDSLTFGYTVIQRGDYVADRELGQKHATIGNSGRATITVLTVGNDTDDADGEIFVTLNNGEGYTASSARSASVVVRDDDNPSVSFADDPATVSEGDGTYDVVVNLVPAPHAATSIKYQIGGVAEAGEDFTIGGLSNGFGSVWVGPGQSSVPIRVRLSDDGTSEDDEWVDIYLRAGENYDVGTPSRYTLTITDNDGPGAQFARADSEVGESDGSVGVTVNLVPAPTEDVTINYTLGGGTATRGTDYSIEGLTGSSGSVTVSAGINSVGIPVTINPDGDSEPDETVVLTLRTNADSDYTVGTTRTHTLTILDDDRPRAEFASDASSIMEADTEHMVEVNLRPAAPAGGLTLSYGLAGGTATRNRDYRASGTVQAEAGDISVRIPVEIIRNGESEPEETVVLTLRVGSRNNVGEESVHTLTITDNNLPMVAFETAEASVSETGRTHRAVITLDPAPHEDLTIGYTVGGTSTEGVHGQHGPGDDFTISNSGTVTVPRGRNQVFVPITIVNDSDAEGDETLTLTLDGGDGYALDTSANIYELTILDDDAPEVSFTAASGEPDEGAGTHVVRVRLDGQTDNPVTVGVSVNFPPNIGSDNTDYHSAIPGSVTIPAGTLETELTVTITDDNLNEADEVVVLTLEPGTGYSLSQDKPTEYTLTIVDNDADENTPVASRDHPHAHGQGSTHFEVYEGHTRIPTWYVTRNFAGDVIFQYVGGTATLDEDFRLFNIDDQIEKVGDTFTVRSLESPHDSDREAGLRWARFTFDPIRDQEREGGETVILRVLNGPDYTVEEPTELTITIID